jgi:hypothetical protein
METAITASDLDDAKRALEAAGYTVFKGAAKPARLPNAQFYDCPFVPAPTLVDHRRSKVVRRTAQEIISRGIRSISSQLNWRTLEQAYVNVLPLEGEVWEAGVFKGVTALLLANAIRHYGPESAKLRLFDSFEGMPEADAERDFHKKGNFSDTSLEGVRDLVGDGLDISYQQGFIPDTFAGSNHANLSSCMWTSTFISRSWTRLSSAIHEWSEASSSLTTTAHRPAPARFRPWTSSSPGARRSLSASAPDRP